MPSPNRLAYIDRGHVEHLLRTAGLVLDEAGYKRVCVRVLNRSIQAVRAESVRLIRAEYNAPARDLRDRMFVTPAAMGRFYALLRAQGEISIPLLRYGARPNTPVSEGGVRPKKGVSVHVLRAEGRKVIGGSFVQRGSRVGPQIFVRNPHIPRGQDGHIRMLYGPGQIQVLRRDRTDRRLQERAEEIASTTALHEASAMLRGIR